MSVHAQRITITASSVQTLSFGNKYYADMQFFTESGTGNGAIKIAVAATNDGPFQTITSPRIALAAGTAPVILNDVCINRVKLTSSATASTTVLLCVGWNELT